MKEVPALHSFADLVSVITPVFNCAKYLHRCVESIINQSYNNLEIILINDGSSDSSGEICNAYALTDSRIRVIHTRNSGPAAARNIGIGNSKGSLIFFIDADDYIENNALNLLVENYKHHNADLIVGDFKKNKGGNYSDSGHSMFFPDSMLLTKQDIVDYVKAYLKKPNRFPLFVYSWGRLFKASIIKDNNIMFNADLRTFEDVAFNFKYLNYTDRLYFLHEPVYEHLIHDDYASASMTISGDPRILFGYRQALTNVAGFLEKGDYEGNTKSEVGHAYICYTIIQLVRTCGQIDDCNKKMIYELIHEIVNDPAVMNNLHFYSPTKGDSRILPLLIKLKLVWPVIWVCGFKARRRYKKGAAR